MSKARLVRTAVRVDRQTPARIAARYGVHRSWISKLKARYETDGEAARQPRSRRPRPARPRSRQPPSRCSPSCARSSPPRPGRRAGHHRLAPRPPSRHHRVGVHHQPLPDPRRAGHPSAEAAQVVRPAVRGHFAQQDLAVRLHPLPAHRARRHPGPDAEILSWLDDCSRSALSVTAHARVTGPIVLAAFRTAATGHGTPRPR
jgi:Winged helix-turn helix